MSSMEKPSRRALRAGLAASLAALLGRPLGAVNCQRTGIEDDVEIASGQARDCNENGIPDGCDLRGSFGFEAPVDFPLDTDPIGLFAGDFDGDARLDVAGV